MLKIEIVGAEDANMRRLETIVQEALAVISVKAEIVKVTDWQEVMLYNIISTPALIIKNQVLCQGIIPSVSELQRLFKAFIPLNGSALKDIPVPDPYNKLPREEKE